MGNKLHEYVMNKNIFGLAKEKLSILSPSKSMTGPCMILGFFVKVIVEIPETSPDQDASKLSVLPNAFSVMMAVQRNLEALENR